MGIEIDLQWDDSMEVFCIGGDSTIPCILPKFSKLCASLRRFLFVVWAEGTRSMAFEKEYRSRRTEFEAWFTKSLLSLGLPLQAVCLSILSSIQSTVYLSFKCWWRRLYQYTATSQQLNGWMDMVSWQFRSMSELRVPARGGDGRSVDHWRCCC